MDEQYLKRFIIGGLRRMSYKWPPRNEAMKKARVGRGLYTCAATKKIHSRKDVQLDHINPVIDPLVPNCTWEDLIKHPVIQRMFCDENGFQVLAKEAHKIKTACEAKTRMLVRKSRKKQPKKGKKK